MLMPADDASATVPGTVYDLDEQQLAAADASEVADYHRIRVDLVSGRSAWAYALAPSHTPGGGGLDAVEEMTGRLGGAEPDRDRTRLGWR